MSFTPLAYDIQTFNNLPEIEFASSYVNSTGLLDKALSTIGPLLIMHNLSDAWGLCIIHRHWRLEEDEIPLQTIRYCNGIREYLSRPISNLTHEAAPTVLRVASNHRTFEPLEYSTDPLALEANDLLSKNCRGRSALVDALIDHSLADNFALIVLKPLPEAAEMIELNFADRVSILRQVNTEDLQGKTLIQTTWRFAPNVAAGKCATKCMSYCNVGADGGHSGGHTAYHDPNG